MSFSSFPLQSTLVLLDPRWGAQVLFQICVFRVVLDLCLGWRTWEGSELKGIGLEVSHV